MESVLRKVVWLFREQPVLAYGFCGCLSAAAVTWTFLKLTTSNELQLSLDTESSNSELQRRVNEAWLQAQRNGALQPLSASAAVVNESDMPVSSNRHQPPLACPTQPCAACTAHGLTSLSALAVPVDNTRLESRDHQARWSYYYSFSL